MTPRTTTPGPVQPVALLTRIAGLLGLLVAVVAILQAPPSLSVLWTGPEAAQRELAEAVARAVWARGPDEEYVRVSPGRSRGGGKTPPRELGALDVQYAVLATKAGLWVAKERGDVFHGCTGRGFLTGEEPERMPKNAEEGEPPKPAPPARPMPQLEFWPNSYESYLIPWAKLGPWPRPAHPAARLRATLLAELTAAPTTEIVFLRACFEPSGERASRSLRARALIANGTCKDAPLRPNAPSCRRPRFCCSGGVAWVGSWIAWVWAPRLRRPGSDRRGARRRRTPSLRDSHTWRRVGLGGWGGAIRR